MKAAITKISLKSDGDSIVGILSEPASEQGSTVLICHGLGTNKNTDTNVALSKALLREGISSLRIDFYGHGESDGILSKFNDERGRANITSAIEYLRRTGRPMSKIGIAGSSIGGEIAIKYAGDAPDLGALVLRASSFDWETRIQASMVRAPTLFICGTDDYVIPIWAQLALFNDFRHKKDFAFIEDAGHKYTEPRFVNQFVSLSVDWFKQNLRKS